MKKTLIFHGVRGNLGLDQIDLEGWRQTGIIFRGIQPLSEDGELWFTEDFDEAFRYSCDSLPHIIIGVYYEDHNDELEDEGGEENFRAFTLKRTLSCNEVKILILGFESKDKIEIITEKFPNAKIYFHNYFSTKDFDISQLD